MISGPLDAVGGHDEMRRVLRREESPVLIVRVVLSRVVWKDLEDAAIREGHPKITGRRALGSVHNVGGLAVGSEYTDEVVATVPRSVRLHEFVVREIGTNRRPMPVPVPDEDRAAANDAPLALDVKAELRALNCLAALTARLSADQLTEPEGRHINRTARDAKR
jgi:hypothetical protein